MCYFFRHFQLYSQSSNGIRIKQLIHLSRVIVTGVEQALEGARREGEAISQQLFAAEREIQELRTTQSKLKDAESNLRAMKEEVSTFKGGDRSELRKV